MRNSSGHFYFDMTSGKRGLHSESFGGAVPDVPVPGKWVAVAAMIGLLVVLVAMWAVSSSNPCIVFFFIRCQGSSCQFLSLCGGDLYLLCGGALYPFSVFQLQIHLSVVELSTESKRSPIACAPPHMQQGCWRCNLGELGDGRAGSSYCTLGRNDFELHCLPCRSSPNQSWIFPPRFAFLVLLKVPLCTPMSTRWVNGILRLHWALGSSRRHDILFVTPCMWIDDWLYLHMRAMHKSASNIMNAWKPEIIICNEIDTL